VIRSFKLRQVCARPTPPDGFNFVAATVSAGGNGLFLFVGNDEEQEVHATSKEGIGIFPKPRMASAKPYLLAVARQEIVEWINLPALDVAYPLVEMFPDGRVLIAGARCAWRSDDDFDLNGIVCDLTNGSTRRLLLGDGIADVAIDGAGRIWVSYFDEGIFGNFGWSHPGPSGRGAGGLVCFKDDGTVLWQFNRQDSDHFIDDCYALNASRDEIWIYFYSAFKVCRVAMDFTQTFYAPEGIEGATALAVSEAAILFSSNYRESPDTFRLLRRDGTKLARPHRVTAHLPNGGSLESACIVGRGSYLHVLNADGWFQTNVDEIEQS
jgi:outer membrane protein assembly factor BamB